MPALYEDLTRWPHERRYLTREEFAAAHGAGPAEFAAIRAFAARQGLRVIEERPGQRSAVLAGTAGRFCDAFQVGLRRYEHAVGSYRVPSGPVHIPPELRGVVQGVFGLDSRASAGPHFRGLNVAPHADVSTAAPRSHSVGQVAELYQFPTNADGSGQCIGILELGGGYRATDLDQFFAQNIGERRPEIVAVSVDGVGNAPGVNGPADAEVAMDVEIAGATAPGAKIAVYFAPATDQGFFDGLNAAIHDGRNKPSVISISWGGNEARWTRQWFDAWSSACLDAAAMGITICVSSGDRGSTDGGPDQLPHVDFPASCPYVLACGGTKLRSGGDQITSETVWNEGPGGTSGGGYSSHFPMPKWQKQALAAAETAAAPAGRGVPDVAGNAAMETGYRIVFGGQTIIGCGTSAVAPLWTGLVARFNELAGKPMGFLNPLLYAALSRGAFNDITSGDNGAYRAAPGWNPCTGLGSPNGAKLAAALLPPLR